MIRVNVLTERCSKFRKWPGYWLPIYLTSRYFKKRGITFRNVREADASDLFDCDILWIASYRLCPANSVGHDEESREQTLKFLEKARDGCGRVWWFDQSDSTGTTQFEVLPYVERYLKKQVLSDLSNYRKDYYGGRIHFEFFNREFGIEDTVDFPLADDIDEINRLQRAKVPPSDYYQTPAQLPEEEDDKLGVSWNIGMHDIRSGKKWRKLINMGRDILEIAAGLPHHLPGRHSPGEDKPLDLVALYDVHRRPPASFQRTRAAEMLEGASHLKVVSGKKIPYAEYVESMRTARCVLSLFGHGEVCYREYETFLRGATLVMPDMSHMTTYPDIYRAGETYQPIKWDLTDLFPAVEGLLDDRERAVEMAAEGQRSYLRHWTREGLESFVDRLVAMIGEPTPKARESAPAPELPTSR